MQENNRQRNIYSYHVNDIITKPQNLGDLSSRSLNFRPFSHYSQLELIDVESIIIKKLDKTLNRCDNETSF